MSFIHYTIVGHFDPATLNASSVTPIRPLDELAVESLLREFSDDIREYVECHDGYAQCCWAGAFPLQTGIRVHEFAYKLAERENCVAAELPTCVIGYSEKARQIQADAWRRWREENPPQERQPAGAPIFNPHEPGPCPYCGKPLRTSIAKQCRFCKMDWHDPENVYRRT